MNLNKDPESWRRVSVESVMGGSKAQGENVLRMAIEDILRLDAELQRIRAAEKHPADGLGEIFTMDEFNQSIRQ